MAAAGTLTILMYRDAVWLASADTITVTVYRDTV